MISSQLLQLFMTAIMSKNNMLRNVELIEAIRSVAGGKMYYGDGIVDIYFDRRKAPPKDNNKTNLEDIRLTKREVQVMLHVGEGLSSKEIADKCNVAISTINTHRRNILLKMKETVDMNNPRELYKFVLENKIALQDRLARP